MVKCKSFSSSYILQFFYLIMMRREQERELHLVLKLEIKCLKTSLCVQGMEK